MGKEESSTSDIATKLINDPHTAVQEALRGVIYSQPDVSLLCEDRVVYSTSAAQPGVKDNRVSLISGGGSGHEPAMAGYVGEGMISAAVCGDVYCSPPASHVLAAIQKVCGSAGCLLVVMNYTGDVLNFGLAMEQARALGYKVDMVIIGDDCSQICKLECKSALSKGNESEYASAYKISHEHVSEKRKMFRRGVAGTVFVHKALASACKDGASLEEVVELAKKMNSQLFTMSLAWRGCAVPGQAPTFRLDEGRVEIGVGIHGEAGMLRGTMVSCEELVGLLIRCIFSSSDFMKKDGENKQPKGVCLLLNNLGAASVLEMSIFCDSVIKQFEQITNVRVLALGIGPYMTALDMAGVSLTTLFLYEDCDYVLNHLKSPVLCGGWKPLNFFSFKDSDGTSAYEAFGKHIDLGSKDLSSASVMREPKGEMKYANEAIFLKCVEAISEELICREGHLNKIDSMCGDGDCGTSFAKAGNAIRNALTTCETDSENSLRKGDIIERLSSLAAILQKSMGGTSGALYSLGLLNAINVACREFGKGNKNSLEENMRFWKFIASEFVAGIMKYGRSAPSGDRCMVDALYPAMKALNEYPHEKKPLDLDHAVEAVCLALEAGIKGANTTMGMEANVGRSSYIQQDILKGHIDPGCMAFVFWMRALLQALVNASENMGTECTEHIDRLLSKPAYK